MNIEAKLGEKSFLCSSQSYEKVLFLNDALAICNEAVAEAEKAGYKKGIEASIDLIERLGKNLLEKSFEGVPADYWTKKILIQLNLLKAIQ